MKELSKDEIQQVQGGIAPIIGLAASAASRFMARGIGSYVVSRVGGVAAIYSALKWVNSIKN